MLLSKIHVSPMFTVEDVAERRVDTVNVLEDQVEGWIFQPADTLRQIGANAKADAVHHNGMAILALELLFFEPHGQFLRGTDKGGSAATFKTGFNAYKQYLMNIDPTQGSEFSYQDLSAKKLYQLGRCGLFHSAQLKHGLLVHPDNEGTLAFRYEPGLSAWIINPWPLLDSLRGYFEHYLAKLRAFPPSPERSAFDDMMTQASFGTAVTAYHANPNGLATLRYPIT